jgi:hypothetical protein
MSPMSKVHAFQTDDWSGTRRDRRDARPPGAASLTLRFRVAVARDRLTRNLADGAEPTSSPELALRAAQLTSRRRCQQLVRTLQRTTRQAHKPPGLRPAVIINRCAVVVAEDAIEAVIARLSYAEPVRAQGMAMAERMITEAAESPLYSAGDPEALRRRALAALDALDAPHHEQRGLPTPA